MSGGNWRVDCPVAGLISLVRVCGNLTLKQFASQMLRGQTYRFSPKTDVTDKANCGVHIFIEPDGSVTQVVRLNVLNDRHREDILGFHFSQQYAELHYREIEEKPQFYLVGRDCPWDFEYVLHDGTTFFLEICRIADIGLLKATKAENDIISLLQKDNLRGYEILKIERHFPGLLSGELVKSVQTKVDKQKVYRVGEQGFNPRIFLRPTMMPRVNLVDEIRTAVSKKVAKPHKGKESTILLLDNLTTHADPTHFFEAVDTLHDYLDEVPFASIWVYTGYYSDDDGHDCEFSLLPIKLSDREIEILESN